MIIHYADDYLFKMQDWNKEVSEQGLETLRKQKLNPMARFCNGKHSLLTSSEPTFLINEVTCKNCLKKLKRKSK